jgi:Rrf2 family protein
MRLQKNTSLALFSVLEVARDPTRHIAVSEIATRYGASPHHLAKVLSELARAGLVDSVRGVGGGYRFAANPHRVTLLDIIQLFEDFRRPAAARARQPGPAPIERALEQVLAEIDELARATFSSITLSTMLKLVDRQQAAGSPNGSRPRKP